MCACVCVCVKDKKRTVGFHCCTRCLHKSNFLSIMHTQIKAGVIKKALRAEFEMMRGPF